MMSSRGLSEIGLRESLRSSSLAHCPFDLSLQVPIEIFMYTNCVKQSCNWVKFVGKEELLVEAIEFENKYAREVALFFFA